jgi:predicted GNAT superfamily acetyltransferase
VTFSTRALTDRDIPQLVDLNNAAVPAVPLSTDAELDALRLLADVAVAAVADGDEDTVLGFVLAMHPGANYDSENYRWFEARGSDSLYVDRIVISEEARGSGLGRLLYGRVFAAAAEEGRVEVTCEVNVEPPNPGSHAFHGILGFAEVGRQATKGGAVMVALLAAPVPNGE